MQKGRRPRANQSFTTSLSLKFRPHKGKTETSSVGCVTRQPLMNGCLKWRTTNLWSRGARTDRVGQEGHTGWLQQHPVLTSRGRSEHVCSMRFLIRYRFLESHASLGPLINKMTGNNFSQNYMLNNNNANKKMHKKLYEWLNQKTKACWKFSKIQIHHIYFICREECAVSWSLT